MKIYTKQGDAGLTALFDGRRVSKDHLRIETYGTVDELNSVLGVAIAGCGHEALRGLLIQLQHQLFVLGGDLATPADSKNAGKIQRITAEHVTFLEKQIDAATEQLPALRRFILPGGGATASQLHIARTVCRRAERRLVTLAGSGENVGGVAIIYVNRVSDLLFTLARLANRLDGVQDTEWDVAAGSI